MRARILNLGAFYKYKSAIDKKNRWGLWWSATIFEFMLFINLVMKIITGAEIRITMAVYGFAAAAGMFLWYKVRDKGHKIQDLFIIFQYLFSIAFTCHCMAIYPRDGMYALFAVTAVNLACVLLMNPFYLILGQIFLAVSFYFTGRLSLDGGISNAGLIFIIATLIISILLGMFLWFARVESIAFENELNYLATGTDERFINAHNVGIMTGTLSRNMGIGEKTSQKRAFVLTFNATKNRITSVRDNNIFDLREKMDWDEVAMRILRYAGDPTTYRSFEKFLLDNTDLKNNRFFTEPQTLVGCFCFRDNERLWLSFEMSLRPHPISGEVMNTILIEDITEERILMGILDNLIARNYNMVMCVERGKHESLIFRTRENEDVKIDTIGDYETEMVNYITCQVADYDRERALKIGHLRNIYEELKASDSLETYIDEISEGSDEPLKKRFLFTYLDSGKRFLFILKEDVTEVVRTADEAKRKLEVALKEAENANEVKSDFLSRMSHEMRTPMNAIMGLAALIEDEINNPDALRDYVSKIKDSSEFLLQLINDVLDMSGIENGQISLNMVSCEYGKLLDGIETMIKPMCKRKGITYVCKNEIPERTIIKTDAMRVTQVFVNILANAVKYTSRGGRVEFNSYLVNEEKGRGYYRFVIKDNGMGMSEEFAARIFEPFSQEKNANTESLKGTGLGLPISKGIVDALGGSISATSKKDVGTTVVIDLDFEVSGTSTSKEVKKEVSLEEIGGKRVLVAEDNEINREIAVAILNRKGIFTDEAVDGAMAVDMFKNSEEWHYDAILMDIRMPKMNGLEATRNIRGLGRKDSGKVPIIAMTANAFSDDVNLSAHSGMNAHLSKPINPELLYETLMREIANTGRI